MNVRCVAACVLLLALTGVAAAQVPLLGPLPSFDTAPAAPPPGERPPGARPVTPGVLSPQGAAPPSAVRIAPHAGPPGAPQVAPGGQQEPPCLKEFLPLREEAQKRAGFIKTAQERAAKDRSVTREEMCQLFKNFSAAEAKVVKFVTDNSATCGIPGEVLTQMKSNHGQTLKIRQQVCTGGPAAAGKAAPPTPKLSDELGLRDIAGPGTSATGRGTFDTLTGSPFQR